MDGGALLRVSHVPGVKKDVSFCKFLVWGCMGSVSSGVVLETRFAFRGLGGLQTGRQTDMQLIGTAASLFVT